MDARSYEEWILRHENESARKKMRYGVARDWERSMAAGVDYINALPEPVPPGEMQKIRHASKKLYIYASSILNIMEQENIFKDIGAALFSSDGVLLKLFGAPVFIDWAIQRGIREETRWDERKIGTNVFSLGAMRKDKARLVGTENYSGFLIEGAYYFAPIILGDGRCYGGLSLILPAEMECTYLIELAAAICRTIELQLIWFKVTEAYTEAIDGYGWISIDQSNGQNRILTMGQEVGKMLSLSVDDTFYEPLEKYIDPLPNNTEFWNIVNNNLLVTDKAVRLGIGGKEIQLNISTSHFREPKVHADGLIIAINSYKRINRLLTRYTGYSASYNFADIIGKSESFRETIKQSRMASASESSVLLLGESGVGKDIIAQAIHNTSSRRKELFVAVNCASFSKELIGSELFGYEDGAFTGAKRGGNIGKFELAHNGTLFLDEIGDMPLDLQAALLRVIEQRSFMKVGGNTMIQTNVRIIAATNRNLSEKIRQGLFREDLFYRLGIIRIQVPPLRQRREDILLLAGQFTTQISSRLQKPGVIISEEAKEIFLKYSWPGNVRELQNLLEGIISSHEENVITADMVLRYLDYGYSANGGDSSVYRGIVPGLTEMDEKEKILRALKNNRGNRTKAALCLGMSRRTLYRRLGEYGIE